MNCIADCVSNCTRRCTANCSRSCSRHCSTRRSRHCPAQSSTQSTGHCLPQCVRHCPGASCGGGIGGGWARIVNSELRMRKLGRIPLSAGICIHYISRAGSGPNLNDEKAGGEEGHRSVPSTLQVVCTPSRIRPRTSIHTGLCARAGSSTTLNSTTGK